MTVKELVSAAPWIGAALMFGMVVFPDDRSTITPAPSAPTATCSAADFRVDGTRGRLNRHVFVVTGTAVNNGALACGVQVKVSSYDAAGVVLDTSDIWPASVRNIAPGASENFSYQLRGDVLATRFDVVPISAKTWQ